MNTTSAIRTIIVALILLTAAATSVTAQGDRERGKEARKARTELRASLRSWFTTSVYPIVKQWHDAFDAQLSASDRAALQQLRTESRQARERLQNGLEKLITASRDERRDLADDVRDDFHTSMKSIFDRVRPIAKASRSFLRDLLDKNETQLENWRDAERKIVDSWRDKYEMDDDHRRGKMGGLPLIGGDGHRAAMRFMLWDGTLDEALNDEGDDRPDRR